MPAPTTPILDNFNRPNGAPGPNWTEAISPYPVPNIVSNALDWPQFPSCAWSTRFGANQEVFVRRAGDTELVLLLRLTNPNSGAENGYLWGIDGTSLALSKRVAGADTLLYFDNFVLDLADNYFWASSVGSTHSFYTSLDGINYTLRTTFVDSTLMDPGLIGLWEPNNTNIGFPLDDFGGGTLGAVSFPTTPILDTFSGTLVNWTNSTFGDGDLTIYSGQVGSPGAGQWGGGLWTPIVGVDQECYVTFATVGANDHWIWVRSTWGATAQTTGYGLKITTTFWEINRCIGGGFTVIAGPGALTMTNGDSYGISVIGSRITAYRKVAGDSWRVLASAVNTEITQQGRLGLEVENEIARADNFGGGLLNANLAAGAMVVR